MPSLDQLNKTLIHATDWQIITVPGPVSDGVFFDHLANRRLPASRRMRRPDQLNYLREPDCSHDIFGHVPLLINPVFANYTKVYGKDSLKAMCPGQLDMLAHLYWYTVEFGLIRTPADLRIYGAGIVSNKGESIYALDSASPNHIGFDMRHIMHTRCRIDTFRKIYFTIDNFEQLFDATRPGFTSLYEEPAALPTIGMGDAMDGDVVLNVENREGWTDTVDI